MNTWFAVAFSLNMLSPEAHDGRVSFRRISPAEAAEILAEAGESAKYSKANPILRTAISEELGIPLPSQRHSVSLRPGDRLVAALPCGRRVDKDADSLPEGVRISYYLLELGSDSDSMAINRQTPLSRAAHSIGAWFRAARPFPAV